MQLAWEYLLSTKQQWQEEYFVAYAFGRMPALSPGSPDFAPLPNYDHQAELHAAKILELAPLFHAFEILNQRFQPVGVSTGGSPVRCTQGHNFSFAHLATDLLSVENFQRDQPPVLVNWDAHADLGDPFDNPSMPIDNPFAQLSDAATFAQRIVIASNMSIAGWILPLIYQGLLSNKTTPAQVIWVVPRESQTTSHKYMPDYGKYSITVGDWLLPTSPDEIARVSTTRLGDWNQPGTREIRRYSEHELLRSVTHSKSLEHQQNCELYIVDPDDSEQLASLLTDRDIVLSVDADYSGTIEPGTRPRKGFLPHYPLNTSAAGQLRHRELLTQFNAFYNRFQSNVRSITVANSPGFTSDDEIRRPVSHILRTVVGNSLSNQPTWLHREVEQPPPDSVSSQSSLATLLTTGGLAGLVATAALLSKDRWKVSKLQRLLFEQSAKSS